MSAIRTHYDNLKVTRDAPPEVIRAAYQALASKYHPDRKPGDREAVSLMQLINAAYDVLSDPVQREQHDRWIRQMELSAQATRRALPARIEEREPPDLSDTDVRGLSSLGPVSLDPNSRERPPVRRRRPKRRWAAALVALFVSLGLGLSWLAVWYAERGAAATRSARVAPADAATPAILGAALTEDTATNYVRPARAPSGESWPSVSSYVGGFKVLLNDGQSTVMLDNAANPSDVYVKLYAHREAKPFVVRWVFVKGKDGFTVRDLRPGRYEVRYRDLDNGAVGRSEPFELREGTVAEGTRITAARIPLRKIAPKPGEGADVDF